MSIEFYANLMTPVFIMDICFVLYFKSMTVVIVKRDRRYDMLHRDQQQYQSECVDITSLVSILFFFLLHRPNNDCMPNKEKEVIYFGCNRMRTRLFYPFTLRYSCMIHQSN